MIAAIPARIAIAARLISMVSRRYFRNDILGLWLGFTPCSCPVGVGLPSTDTWSEDVLPEDDSIPLVGAIFWLEGGIMEGVGVDDAVGVGVVVAVGVGVMVGVGVVFGVDEGVERISMEN